MKFMMMARATTANALIAAPMQHIALRILVVEDNDELRDATLTCLHHRGHDARGVPMAEDIDDVTGGFVPDVYVIDLNLPDEDGLSLTRRLRAAHPGVGIVITTARTLIGDKVVAYESGADMYLTKPVHPQELIASLSALGSRLRVRDHQPSAMSFDLTRQQLSGPNGNVELTASDALILTALARAPGQKLERWQISAIVCGDDAATTSAGVLEMRIARLRKKLSAVGAPSPQIKALHKVGYALCCPVMLR
ncbi:response regulator transcription factor [Hydrogenophaga taeniospiralis]|uniref:response regulator transcription factor n=1 Tax=Hydrogenophaga taeniospiralis TaxID=65656 RepID=UPI001CFB98E9|nr:response regulator transcription factor [Hydrogenophaga taeniospiralis]UCU92304.1 response regulator transcription factor [Hydrogenophaga taeniospiralis]